jgi:hypothetical protein
MLHPEDETPSNNKTVEMRLKNVIDKRMQAINAINQTAQTGQMIPSQYRLGEQVWLEVTHLKIHHQKMKLNPKRYRPFEIIKEISPVAYQLKLPMAWRIHDVFHASLLLPYRKTTVYGPNFSSHPLELIDGEEEYQVECIMGHKKIG